MIIPFVYPLKSRLHVLVPPGHHRNCPTMSSVSTFCTRQKGRVSADRYMNMESKIDTLVEVSVPMSDHYKRMSHTSYGVTSFCSTESQGGHECSGSIDISMVIPFGHCCSLGHQRYTEDILKGLVGYDVYFTKRIMSLSLRAPVESW